MCILSVPCVLFDAHRCIIRFSFHKILRIMTTSPDFIRVFSDRYVLVGNHRDAWVFGAVDPSTGTAIMMEISRVMGNLVKSGK